MSVKLVAWGVIGILLFAAGVYCYRSIYESGEAHVQALWNADKAAIQKVTDAAIAQATAQRDMALEANEAIHNDYETRLSAANADANDFALRLRHAYAHPTGSGSVQQGSHQQGPAPALPPRGDERLDGLLAAAAAETLKNDDALDALVAQINRQQIERN